MQRWHYYLFHFVIMGAFFLGTLLVDFSFPNAVFFLLAYAWHFTLETPGAKEMWVKSKKRYSFVAMVFRFNHYLQIYAIQFENKFPAFIRRFRPSIVRSLSPLLFAVILLFFGGHGNLFFVLLGSLFFEGARHFLGNLEATSGSKGGL